MTSRYPRCLLLIGSLLKARYNFTLSSFVRRKHVEKRKVLVCSAWPYASGVPHLGNLVSSLLSGDVFARYYRMRGHDVLYVSGTDAHGTRIEYEARQRGISPAELAAFNHQQIRSVIEGFGIVFDNYTTTESPVHKQFIQEIYLKMEQQGYILTREEERAYCRNCRLFLADRFITGTCPRCGASGAMGNQCDACGAIIEPEELIDPVCSFCGKKDIEFRRTRHWYLDLTKLSPRLSDYVASRHFQGNVHRLTQRMIEEGLKPRAMTRDIAWGIPAPFKGAEGKVIYVWGEAALGYVSATVEHFDGELAWKDFWFGEDVHQIYTIGKDNIPFHTLIFPGQLIASGRGYHLPDQIAATEYLNWIGGQSFSKSRGVGLYCDDALKVIDAELWRFYLLYNRPEGRDVNFSWEELGKAVNGVLISNIANLINRVLSFIQTRYAGVVPTDEADSEVKERLENTISDYERAMEAGFLSQALRAVCLLAVAGNEYFQRKEPWETKDKGAVAGAFHLVKGIVILLFPFLPKFSSSVLAVMGIDGASWKELEKSDAGRRLTNERVLIERIDVEKIKK
ncbi:TPA: methionine--tRNA ligase [Candidatus Acetothermia bacterium]|nr:methionine--tRNA ligase [Candidatus Acetothermia bacterium]